MTGGRKRIAAALILALCTAVASPPLALASVAPHCATACRRSEPMVPCQHECCAYQRQDDQGLPSHPSKVGGRSLRATPGWNAPPVAPPTPAIAARTTGWADAGPPLFVRLLSLRR